jgi:hypothetical protein
VAWSPCTRDRDGRSPRLWNPNPNGAATSGCPLGVVFGYGFGRRWTSQLPTPSAAVQRPSQYLLGSHSSPGQRLAENRIFYTSALSPKQLVKSEVPSIFNPVRLKNELPDGSRLAQPRYFNFANRCMLECRSRANMDARRCIQSIGQTPAPRSSFHLKRSIGHENTAAGRSCRVLFGTLDNLSMILAGASGCVVCHGIGVGPSCCSCPVATSYKY